MINSYEIKKTLKFNCLYSKTYLFEDKNLYINSAKDISVGKITSIFKSDSQIKGLAMIKRKYLEEGSYFFSEIFGKIIINKSVGSIFL